MGKAFWLSCLDTTKRKETERQRPKEDKKRDDKKKTTQEEKNRIESNEKKKEEEEKNFANKCHTASKSDREPDESVENCVYFFFTAPKMCDDIEYQQMPWHGREKKKYFLILHTFRAIEVERLFNLISSVFFLLFSFFSLYLVHFVASE